MVQCVELTIRDSSIVKTVHSVRGLIAETKHRIHSPQFGLSISLTGHAPIRKTSLTNGENAINTLQGCSIHSAIDENDSLDETVAEF